MMSLLETRGLTRAFGSLIAINDVSLAVEPGELRAVIGPNGAGKTTFFTLISGLFPPTRGSIFFNGQDITRLSANKRVALGVSRTFQVTEIFPELTVSENLMIAVESAAGLRLSPWLSRATRRRLADRVVELLVAGGLVGKGTRLAGELSHGDQRATEIMMALALKPVLLLLDEPTAGMGEQETHDVVRLIGKLHKNERLSIVLIEHDMRVIFHLADRITVLAEGSVLADGKPDEIAANERVQAAYLGSAH
jgi:branched-chain amino acid transport system ATP-binding protein